MRVLRIYLMMATVAFAVMLAAAPRAAAGTAVPRDTASAVVPRAFSGPRMEHYRDSPEFRYDASRTRPRGLWDRIRYWFRWLLAELFGAATGTVAGRIISVVVLVGVVAYMATRMAGVRQAPLDRGSSHPREVFVSESDIHQVDFTRAILAAADQGNFRLAVRLWYLSTLKQLSDKGAIDWRPGKTNYAYLAEVASMPYRAEFASLTADFESSWYGDQPVRQERYHLLERQFMRFHQQIAGS
jgi:hypothetical protein